MVHHAKRSSSSDGGNTLIEVLVAVMILGIAVLGVLAGMATSIQASERQRQQAQTDNVLVGSVESLKKASKVPCATPDESTYVAAAQAAASAQGWGASSVSITAIRYWDGSSYGTTCYDNATNRLPLQQITIRAVHPAGGSPRTLTFVKGPG